MKIDGHVEWKEYTYNYWFASNTLYSLYIDIYALFHKGACAH